VRVLNDRDFLFSNMFVCSASTAADADADDAGSIIIVFGFLFLVHCFGTVVSGCDCVRFALAVHTATTHDAVAMTLTF
jgi:uncharacterized protein YbaA (DUF1428 family)